MLVAMEAFHWGRRCFRTYLALVLSNHCVLLLA